MAKGGGAWKVAYADFVTAMMAFFLVMWICSQDQKIKQAVARYFITPIGIVDTGASNRPHRTGAIFPIPTSGDVPRLESVDLGQGRVSHTLPADVRNNTTKLISDWLQNSDMSTHWQRETHDAREHARMSSDLLERPEAVDEVAVRQLSRKLREQVSRSVHSDLNELSQELISEALAEVNWTELAEDLLAQSAKQSPAKPAKSK